MNIEQFEVAAAVHNSGGIVIAQVDRVVKQGSIPAKEVLIHGFMVDYLVEGRPEYSMQSFETDAFRPEIAGLASIPAVGFDPLPMGPRKICCRRAAMELRPNSLINLGIGMPGGIGSVAEEEGLTDLFTLSLECGPLGGIPLGGIDFGATINPEAMYRMADILQLYDGGALDMAVLGFAEVDRLGNVNAHSFNNRMVGAGGFIDITQNVKKLCFIGTFTAGKQTVKMASPFTPRAPRKSSCTRWRPLPSQDGRLCARGRKFSTSQNGRYFVWSRRGLPWWRLPTAWTSSGIFWIRWSLSR